MDETSSAGENQGTTSLDAVDSGSFDDQAVKERPAEGDQHESSVDLYSGWPKVCHHVAK